MSVAQHRSDPASDATPCQRLYEAAGRPPVVSDRSRYGPMCGGCRQRGAQVHGARDILSAQFGSWDDIATDVSGGRWLCDACAYAYRSMELRRAPRIILDHPGGVETPGFGDLRSVLLSGPIPASMAVIFPVGGKRIVAPRARWGMIATDFRVFPWVLSHARWLSAVMRLRDFGFGEKALSSPSPPFNVLVKVPTSDHEHVRQLWAILDAARRDKALLPVLVKLTRADR